MPKTHYIEAEEANEMPCTPFIKKGDTLSEFFEISDKAREGGMGDVFFCRDKRDNKFYVLKTFKTNDLREIVVHDKDGFPKETKFRSETEITLKNFQKEAFIALQMPRLPYVVFTKTLIAEGLKQYLVMDFIGKQPRSLEESVHGETLARVLRNTKIEYKQTLIWAIEFCRGMRNLHKHGIPVHKDIKLDNILLAPDNTICITDFGLSVLNKKGGTKGYFPPEYSETFQLTEQSDIYSFGVVLYQLFFNTLSTKLNQEKIEKNSLLKRCLQKNPKKRYQSFSHLEQDLKKELKKLFPEYKLPIMPHLTMTADDYFLKGLGLYTLNLSVNHSKELQPLPIAKKLLSKSIQLNPSNASTYYYRARILGGEHPFAEYYVRANDKRILPDSVEKRAIKKIQFDEKHAQQHSAFYANLIELEHYHQQQENSFRQRDKVSFLENFKKYSNKYPRDPFLHNNLGVFETKQGHYKEAIEQFTKAIKLLPNYAVAYSNRATVYLYQNKGHKALKDCAKYTQLECNKKSFVPLSLFYGIYVQIFDYYCYRKKYKEAYKWYEKLLDLFPTLNSIQRKRMLNRVYFQIQYYRLTHPPLIYNRNEILKEYRQIWKLYRQIQLENLGLKKEDWFDKQEKQSLRLSTYGFSKKPDMRPIFFNRLCIQRPTASILNEMGYYKAAWEINSAPEIGMFGPFFGKRAIPFFDKAIAADGTYAPAYYNRARAYEECGDYRQAIADYTKAMELAPEQICVSDLRRGRYINLIYAMIDPNASWSMRAFGGDYTSSHHLSFSAKLHIETSYSSHYIGDHLVVDKSYNQAFVPDPAEKIYRPILKKAQCYFCLGKYHKALLYFEKAEKQKAPTFYKHKGICLYQLAKYKEAIECFMKEAEKDRNEIDLLASISLCYAKLGNKRKEKFYFEQAFSKFFSRMAMLIDPDIREGVIRKTGQRIMVKQKNNTWVKVKFKKEITDTIVNYFKHYYGKCLGKGQFFDISYLYDSVTDENPDLYIDNAYLQRAKCYFALKDYTHALEDYNKALSLDNIIPMLLVPKFRSYTKGKIETCKKALQEKLSKKK